MTTARLRAILLVTMLLFPSTLVTGQQANPRSRAAAEKLQGVLKADRNLEQIMQLMMKTEESMIASQNVSDEQKKRLTDRMNTLTETIMKPLMEKAQGVVIDAYAATFTAEELEGLVAFYQSPLGQKFVEKQPELMAATIQGTTEFAQSLLPEMQRKMQEELRREAEASQKK
jgi:hypothetical protein